MAVGEAPLVDLGLDLGALGAAGFQRGHFDLVVEVADVADDRVVLHRFHVGDGDDVAVAGGGDEDVGARHDFLEPAHLIALHRRLQGADRVDLGDDHAGALAAQRGGAALADVAVAADDRDLAADHHVGGAVDPVDQRVAAAVEVVELRLGDRVVDVDRREQQVAGLGQLVEAVDAGRGLLGDPLDLGGGPGPALRVFAERALQQSPARCGTPPTRRWRGRARRRPSRTRRLCGRAGWRRRRRRGSCSDPRPPGQLRACSVHHQYSSSVSPFQA